MDNRERAKALDKDKGDDEIASGEQGENGGGALKKKSQQEHKQLTLN